VITCAYLVADHEVRADRVIAGMPAILRQILSLQAVGVTDVVLVGVPRQLLQDDARVRIDVREAAELPAASSVPTLVAVAGSVWSPAFLQTLVRTAVPSDSAMVFVRPDALVVVPRSAAGVESATALLMRSLYKPTDGIVSRYLNRRFSLPISRRLLPFDVTPNHLTALATLFGLAGVAVAYRGGYWPLLAGTLLLQAQSVLDGCDGEIARIKYLHSRAGEWFDQVADDVLNVGFLAAVGVVLMRSDHRWAGWVASVSVGCQAVYMVALYAGLAFKAGGRGSVATLRWWVDKPGPSSSPIHIVGDLARRDFICFFYLVCALFNAIEVAWLWHAAVTIVSAVVTTIGWIAFGGPEFRGTRSAEPVT
jgi:CDP-L-myo-inositol myo-inositolphosphotransferase